MFVLHHFAGADAKHDVMRVVIAPAQKMNVVRRDQTDAEVFRDFRQHAIALALLFHAVVVQLHEEIFRAENVAIFGRGLFGDVDLVRLNRGIHFAGETTAQADQSRGMLREKFLVDPRPVMKSVEMRGRNQFNEIAIAGFVLRQQA